MILIVILKIKISLPLRYGIVLPSKMINIIDKYIFHSTLCLAAYMHWKWEERESGLQLQRNAIVMAPLQNNTYVFIMDFIKKC